MRRNALVLILAFAFVGLLIAGVILWDQDDDAPEAPIPFALTTVDDQTLAQLGIELQPPPPGFAPRVSRAEAEASAGEQARRAGIQEAALATVRPNPRFGIQHCVCWVISINPGATSLPAPSNAPARRSFHLVFVDAEGGSRGFAIASTAPD